MQLIDLQAIPNQSFFIRFDAGFFNLAIKETRGVMSCDIMVNNVVVLTGSRIVSGYPLLPYQYQTNSGNFIILTKDEEYPYYDKFNVSQFLIYLSPTDIEKING